jgi:hypothetical protein
MHRLRISKRAETALYWKVTGNDSELFSVCFSHGTPLILATKVYVPAAGGDESVTLALALA